ncbi:hypothetical protein ES703_81242 [subsurface metagenome]
MHYYKQIENGKIISVEAKSIDATSPNFIKATKAEYDSFIASLPPPPPPEPVRDLAAEIDDHEARLLKLEKRR